eukprot:s959_g6.t1
MRFWGFKQSPAAHFPLISDGKESEIKITARCFRSLLRHCFVAYRHSELLSHVALEHSHFPTARQGGRARETCSLVTGKLMMMQTWWGFAEGVPQVLKTVRVKGLIPLTSPERNQAPRPLPSLPPVPPKEDISAQSTYNNDVSFEVLRAAARGAGSRIQSQGQRSSTEVEGGKVRAVKALPSSCHIFRLRPEISAGQPGRSLS